MTQDMTQGVYRTPQGGMGRGGTGNEKMSWRGRPIFCAVETFLKVMGRWFS